MTAIKTIVAGFGSFLLGFLLLGWGLYFALVRGIGEDLNRNEELAFKISYFAVFVISGTATLGISWLAARWWRLNWTTSLVALLLVGASLAYIVPLTSWSNDCDWGLEWPMKVECN